MTKRFIYLDHAAATPLRPSVVEAMHPWLTAEFGNPSAITTPGVRAKQAIEETRQKVAQTLSVHADEIIFTGSGTESTNLALQGIMRTQSEGHLIVSAIEHHSVLEPARLLEQQGYQVSIAPVQSNGIIKVETITKLIRPDTRLISIMLANNEIGTLQPITELARTLKRINRQRVHNGLPIIIFHTDACQATPYSILSIPLLGVDALTLNGAKIGGPKGVGVLYVRRGIPLVPLITGGGQESGRRAGTEDVASIVGLGVALFEAQTQAQQEAKRLGKLRDRMLTALKQAVPEIIVNGDMARRLPNNINVTIPGIDAESLVLYLDHDGVMLGTGAACSHRTLESSHVLTAIGCSGPSALSSVRLTLGRTTTTSDATQALKRIISRIQWMKTMSQEKVSTT